MSGSASVFTRLAGCAETSRGYRSANADKVLRESNWSENSELAIAAATPMVPLATPIIPSAGELAQNDRKSTLGDVIKTVLISTTNWLI